jgi:hypothetical protein
MTIEQLGSCTVRLASELEVLSPPATVDKFQYSPWYRTELTAFYGNGEPIR